MGITLNRASAATVSFNTPQEIVITHLDDSMRLGDGTNLLTLREDNSIPTTPVKLASIVDEASSSVLYVGEASIGANQASAVWRIKKVTTSGTQLVTTWADGNADFDNIWSNRASLTYT